MKKKFVFLSLISAWLWLGASLPTLAADQATNEQPAASVDSTPAKADPDKVDTPKQKLKARIDGQHAINGVINRTLLFTGDHSLLPTDADVEYKWDFGDGIAGFGIDATHTYTRSGTYNVTLTLTDRLDHYKASQDSVQVSVQDQLMVLISDQSIQQVDVDRLVEFGLTQGVLVVSLRADGIDQEYQSVQNLAQQLLEHKDDVGTAQIIMTWTTGNTGLYSLIELARISELNAIPVDQFGFDTKAIVSVSNGQAISAAAKTAQTAFEALHAGYIIVADRNMFDDVLSAADPDDLRTQLTRTDAAYQLITPYTERGLSQLTPLNFMSRALNFMINKGVPINSVFLILMLPIMATVIAAARQLVGLKAFGIFAPTVVALSFLATGLNYGIALFLIVILLGTLARLMARRIKLLYLPRMALVLSIVALAIFALYFLGAWLGATGLIAISIFPILIMTVLTEHFISVQIEQGYKAALKLTFETLFLSLLGYWIGDWSWFRTTILAYPELVLLTVVLNILLGKFAGLRLTEFLRFRSVFKQINHVDEKK